MIHEGLVLFGIAVLSALLAYFEIYGKRWE